MDGPDEEMKKVRIRHAGVPSPVPPGDGRPASPGVCFAGPPIATPWLSPAVPGRSSISRPGSSPATPLAGPGGGAQSWESCLQLMLPPPIVNDLLVHLHLHVHVHALSLSSDKQKTPGLSPQGLLKSSRSARTQPSPMHAWAGLRLLKNSSSASPGCRSIPPHPEPSARWRKVQEQVSHRPNLFLFLTHPLLRKGIH